MAAKRSKRKSIQDFFKFYKEQTGEMVLDMKKVAKFAAAQGWTLPPPETLEERLEKQFRQAAREEIRYDRVTGDPYRAYHSIAVQQGQQTIYLWIDIDEAPRHLMLKSLIHRREGTVDDMVQLVRDAEHWSRAHPDEEPILIPTDITDDVLWEKNAPKKKRDEAA